MERKVIIILIFIAINMIAVLAITKHHLNNKSTLTFDVYKTENPDKKYYDDDREKVALELANDALFDLVKLMFICFMIAIIALAIFNMEKNKMNTKNYNLIKEINDLTDMLKSKEWEIEATGIVIKSKPYLESNQEKEKKDWWVFDYDANSRNKEATANLLILTETMKQLAHLIPSTIKSFKEQLTNSTIDIIRLKLDSLAYHTRKLYELAKYTEEDFQMYDTGQSPTKEILPIAREYNSCIELINLKYFDKNVPNSASSLIERINFEPSNVKLPPFVLFNLIANAFHHGTLAELNHKNKYGKLKIERIDYCDKGYTYYEFTNDCPTNSKYRTEGTGLRFITNVIKNWNGEKVNTQFLFYHINMNRRKYFRVSFNFRNSE